MCRLNLKLYLSLLFVLLLLAVSPLICFAEPTYQVTESDMQKLLEISNQLNTLNNKLSLELIDSKKSLTLLQSELENYKSELTQLSEQLTVLQTESTLLKEQLEQAAILLSNTEKSFLEYSKAVEGKIKSLKFQRNLAGLVAIIEFIILIF